VNGLIVSLLFKATPGDVKFLMVDPKMVELAQYNGLPHMLCPVVTDAKKVATALHWVTTEMDERYQLLAKEGLRNIEAYNQKKQKLPYIVVIIDELADLMVVAKDQIESAIARLAQLSRAVGIHLVLATQRPSVDVITGVIKANFPARISFKVASKVDSRTVLDMNGAEKLLGRGDLLFLKPGQAKPIRAQSSFLKNSEIENILNFIKKQGEPVYDEAILKQQEQAQLGGHLEKDELYETAAKLIIESGQASVSILQRRLRLGYTRAARLIDMMEAEGLVGPYQGSKPRDILVNREQWIKEQMEKERKQNG
jgi:S-DNA-T family DNA segregation ATPase FtsK/SpoIIIE